MKKNILFLVVIIITAKTQAQQFEWVKTFKNTGIYANNYNAAQDLCNAIFINNKILISGMAAQKQIDLDPNFNQNLFYTSGYKNADRYLSILDENGNSIASNMVYTPNGGDGPSILNYNNFTKTIKFGFFTISDSVKFGKTEPWKIKNKKTNYLINYDTLLNFKNAISIYCNNFSMISDVVNDKLGNTYILGEFKDSLIINGKFRLKSKVSNTYLMKLNSLDSIVWITHSNMAKLGNFPDGKKLLYFNQASNTVITLFVQGKNKRGVMYYQSDSLVYTPNTTNFQYLISQINANTGKIDLANSFTSNSTLGLALTEINGNDSLLLLTGFSYENNNILTLDSKTYNLNLSKYNNTSPYLICLNARTLKHKYIQIFDSCNFTISISNIFNDSLYYVLGATLGNQNFDFKNYKIKSADFLPLERVNAYASTDFFAQYSSNNSLKYVWQLPPVQLLTTSTNNNTAKILNNNGNIYIVGNINYSLQLGLGGSSFKYSTGSSVDVSVLKYNCKPTAFFNFTQNGKKVDFKNLSSNSNSYLWQFPINNDNAITKDASYTFPSLGATYPTKLIVSNDCGKDTFTQDITINASSINNIFQKTFNLAPNPSNGFTTLSILNLIKNINIEIMDLNGKKVFAEIETINSNTFRINTSKLVSGIYTISLVSEQGRFSKKLIVFN